MKNKAYNLIVVLVFILPFSLNINARTPIESDSIGIKLNTEAIDALVGIVEIYGYKCDSISSARPFVLSRSFTLVCNNFAYHYEIEDKGGNWIVTVE